LVPAKSFGQCPLASSYPLAKAMSKILPSFRHSFSNKQWINRGGAILL
jgi:hypothetical protein